MEPLIALIATTLTVHFVARSRAPNWRPWPVALRTGVAFMFIMTGISHFIGKREELIAMVPPALPAPELLVAVTGILELAGAGALLLWPVMRRWPSVDADRDVPGQRPQSTLWRRPPMERAAHPSHNSATRFSCSRPHCARVREPSEFRRRRKI